jgi:succinate dehydrogenase/fumarate reductase cytochrome b subunit
MNADLLPSLRRLVRGLSAIFWGLPSTLLVCVLMAVAEFPRALGSAPPVVTTGLLLFGVFELSRYQPQERAWQGALDRAKLLALVNFGLSPFVYFWSRLPTEAYYLQIVIALALTGLLFLYQLNLVLQRLAALLPDETLREDTRFFTRMNLSLMLTGLVVVGGYHLLAGLDYLPQAVIEALDLGQLARIRFALVVVLVLLPVSVTMSLVWKTRDVVLSSVFGARS